MADPSAIWLVLTTEADADQAERLAEALLERRLVACVSLTPIRSHFHWKGEVIRDNEVQLLLKTTQPVEAATRCDAAAQLRHTGNHQFAGVDDACLRNLCSGCGQFRCASASCFSDT